MKKLLTLIIITLFCFSNLFGQNRSTKKADKLFDRFEYVKAAKEYLKIANNGADNYVIGRLADCYYNIFSTREAEKWYSKIINEDPDIEVIFRYSQIIDPVYSCFSLVKQ